MKKSWIHRYSYVALLVYTIFFAGCGFELRGTLTIAPDLVPIYVKAEGGSRTAVLLKELLLLNKIPMTDDAKTAKLTIRILEENYTNRISAVDRNGKAIGNELRYQIAFDAVRADGSALIDRQIIEANRDYVDPASEVLGKTQEAASIQKDLEQDIANRILSRLRPRLRPL